MHRRVREVLGYSELRPCRRTSHSIGLVYLSDTLVLQLASTVSDTQKKSKPSLKGILDSEEQGLGWGELKRENKV